MFTPTIKYDIPAKTITIGVIACLLILGSSFLPFHSHSGVDVQITGLKNDKGHLLLSLFKEGGGFPDDAERAYRTLSLPIKNRQATGNFTDLPDGIYAIAILHDENDDARMNKNMLGIPKEGFGFSNNASAPFGPPPFSKASFQHIAAKLSSITIKIRYF